MAITRWEPFGRNAIARMGFERMKQHLDRLFNDFYRTESEDVVQSSPKDPSDWMPFADISEDGDQYRIQLEAPGMEKKDIKVSLQNDTLTISGEKKLEREKKDRTYHLIERTHGQFSRSFTLPARVDEKKIKAEFKNGVLDIILPKAPGAKAREIEIALN